MSNRLPSTRTIPALSLPEAKISALHGKLEEVPGRPNSFCVRQDRAATTAERRALSAVAERLEAELQGWRADLPRDRGAVDAIVSRVLLGFEQGRGRSEAEDEVLVGEYLSALKGLPLAAIHAAAERFRSGETLKPWVKRFRPSPAEFATEARAGLVPTRALLVHVRRILTAEVYPIPSEADQAEVKAISAAYLEGRNFREERERAAPSPREVAAAREASLLDMGAAAVRACDPATMARLNRRIDARRGIPGGGA